LSDEQQTPENKPPAQIIGLRGDQIDGFFDKLFASLDTGKEPDLMAIAKELVDAERPVSSSLTPQQEADLVSLVTIQGTRLAERALAAIYGTMAKAFPTVDAATLAQATSFNLFAVAIHAQGDVFRFKDQCPACRYTEVASAASGTFNAALPLANGRIPHLRAHSDVSPDVGLQKLVAMEETLIAKIEGEPVDRPDNQSGSGPA